MKILDTDVLSTVLKTRQPRRLRRELDDIALVCTTAINAAELLYGVTLRDCPDLTQKWEARLRPRLSVIPFDHAAAEEYVRVRLYLQAQQMPLGDMDLMIASVALANDAVLVTGNTRHFARVPGLQLENLLE